MHTTRFVNAILIGAVLLVPGCQRTAIADKYHPAKVDSTDVQGIMRVTLDQRAAERVGIETAPVREDRVEIDGRMVTRKVVPYGAIMYDTKGDTWTFTSPAPLVYVRQRIVVEDVHGDVAILSEGPAVGTSVVTVGAAELMGAEHNYGH